MAQKTFLNPGAPVGSRKPGKKHVVQYRHIADGAAWIGGSSELASGKVFRPSGGAWIAGLAVISKTTTAVGMVAAWIAGGAASVKSKIAAGSGNIVVSGTGLASTSKTYVASGAAIANGSSGLQKGKQAAALGAAWVDGAATISYAPEVYVGSGGIWISGTAVVLRSKALSGSGSAVIGGSAAHQHTTVHVHVAGGAVSPAPRFFVPFRPPRSEYLHVGSGAIRITGGAVVSKSTEVIAAGGAEVAASAPAVHFQVNVFGHVGIGLILAGGAADAVKSKSAGAGSVGAAGSADISISKFHVGGVSAWIEGTGAVERQKQIVATGGPGVSGIELIDPTEEELLIILAMAA